MSVVGCLACHQVVFFFFILSRMCEGIGVVSGGISVACEAEFVVDGGWWRAGVFRVTFDKSAGYISQFRKNLPYFTWLKKKH